MKRLLSCILLVALPAVAIAAETETWTVDPVHSTAQFTARHFGVVPVVGTIPIKSATVKLGAGSEIPSFISATLDPSGVDTHWAGRDNDLRSPHFFDAQTYPEVNFTSTKISGGDPKHFTIVGDLTLHGQTHPVTLDAQFVGGGTTPRGRAFYAYRAMASIDRTEWGITYGPMIVGSKIDIALTVEADKR